ncbi:MAG: hypothetical protein KJN90_05860 [Gammaproteobacteria bacterium]|nr:hypothetical protein [Gammaproteobacteria bacterium]
MLKLVGGTPGYIARPFLYSGLMLGAAGSIIAGLMMLSAQVLVSAPIDNLLSLYESEIAVPGYGPLDILLAVMAGAALGWLGASIAVLMQLYPHRLDSALKTPSRPSKRLGRASGDPIP